MKKGFVKEKNYLLFLVLGLIFVLGFVVIVMAVDPPAFNPEEPSTWIAQNPLTALQYDEIIKKLKDSSFDINSKIASIDKSKLFDLLYRTTNWDDFNLLLNKLNSNNVLELWKQIPSITFSDKSIRDHKEAWSKINEESRKNILKSFLTEKDTPKQGELFKNLWEALKTSDGKIDSEARKKLVELLGGADMKDVRKSFFKAITGKDINLDDSVKLEYSLDKDGKIEHIYAVVGAAKFDLLNLPNVEKGFKITGVDVSGTTLKLTSDLQGDRKTHTFSIDLKNVKGEVLLDRDSKSATFGQLTINEIKFNPFYGFGGETVSVVVDDKGILTFGGNGYVRYQDRLYGKNTGDNPSDVLNLVLGSKGEIAAAGDIFVLPKDWDPYKNTEPEYFVVRSNSLNTIYSDQKQLGSKGGILIGSDVALAIGVEGVDIVGGLKSSPSIRVGSVGSKDVRVARFSEGKVSLLVFGPAGKNVNELIAATFKDDGGTGFTSPNLKPAETPVPQEGEAATPDGSNPPGGTSRGPAGNPGQQGAGIVGPRFHSNPGEPGANPTPRSLNTGKVQGQIIPKKQPPVQGGCPLGGKCPK